MSNLILCLTCYGQINDNWESVKIGNSVNMIRIYCGSNLVWEKGGTFDESEYLVVTYSWNNEGGRDLDIAAEFVTSTITDLDSVPVGYRFQSFVKDGMLRWAGDNTSNDGSESILIDISRLKGEFYNDIPNITSVDLYAVWFGEKRTGDIKMLLKSYVGGTMSTLGTSFINTEGTLKAFEERGVNISAYPHTIFYRTDFTYIGKVSYNKITDIVEFDF